MGLFERRRLTTFLRERIAAADEAGTWVTLLGPNVRDRANRLYDLTIREHPDDGSVMARRGSEGALSVLCRVYLARRSVGIPDASSDRRAAVAMAVLKLIGAGNLRDSSRTTLAPVWSLVLAGVDEDLDNDQDEDAARLNLNQLIALQQEFPDVDLNFHIINADDWQQIQPVEELTATIDELERWIAAEGDYGDGSIFLRDLGAALGRRYQRDRQRADIERSITVFRAALAPAEGDPEDLAPCLYNLALALKTEFDDFGVLDSLDEAVDRYEQAAAVAPTVDEQCEYLACYAETLVTRARHKNSREDLVAASDAVELSLQLAEGARLRPEQLHALARSLHLRHEFNSDLASLEKAAVVCRRLLDEVGIEHSDYPVFASTFAGILQDRAHALGTLADVDSAINLLDAVLKIKWNRHDADRLMGNLASAFAQRHTLSEDADDASRALELVIARMDLTRQNHPERPSRMASVSAAYAMKFQSSRERQDIEESVRWARDAMREMPKGHADFVYGLNSLSTALQLRYEAAQDTKDLEEALRVHQQVVALLPVDSPRYFSALINLGLALSVRLRLTREPADLASATTVWRETATSPLAPVATRIQAYGNLGADLYGGATGTDSDSAASTDAYAAAVALMPLLVRQGTFRRDDELALRSIRSIPRNAASAALTLGDPLRALQLLETGRSILWSRLLEMRSDIDPLRLVAPDIAQRMFEIQYILNGTL